MNPIIKFGEKYSLTGAEMAVVESLMKRKTNNEIRKELGYASDQVVKNLLNSVYRKTKVSTRMELYGFVKDFIDGLDLKSPEFKLFCEYKAEFLSFMQKKRALQVSMGLA